MKNGVERQRVVDILEQHLPLSDRGNYLDALQKINRHVCILSELVFRQYVEQTKDLQKLADLVTGRQKLEGASSVPEVLPRKKPLPENNIRAYLHLYHLIKKYEKREGQKPDAFDSLRQFIARPPRPSDIVYPNSPPPDSPPPRKQRKRRTNRRGTHVKDWAFNVLLFALIMDMRYYRGGSRGITKVLEILKRERIPEAAGHDYYKLKNHFEAINLTDIYDCLDVLHECCRESKRLVEIHDCAKKLCSTYKEPRPSEETIFPPETIIPEGFIDFLVDIAHSVGYKDNRFLGLSRFLDIKEPFSLDKHLPTKFRRAK
jgi:hypothetical protein